MKHPFQPAVRAISARLHAPGVLLLVLTVLAAGQALGWLLAAWVGPSPAQLSSEAHGHESVHTAVSSALGGHTVGLDAMAVAIIDMGPDGARGNDGSSVHFATFGRQLNGEPVNASTRFEIGSLTKVLTGQLLQDLIDAGRIEPDMTLADTTRGAVPLTGEGADATLARLARHRAGWPSLPMSMLPRTILQQIGGRNPYVGDPDSVLRIGAARSTSRGDQAYSNLGFAALGNALAIREGSDYATLLEQRVLTPLDMHDTRVLGSDDPLPDRRVQGRDSAGRASEAWRASGWQAAGIGVWATADDLSKLAAAVLDGTAPGQGATLAPATDGGQHRKGYGWNIRDIEGHEVLWHNGGTGGFRTWFGLDRAEGRGVAVLSNTVRPVDELGLRLLIGDTSDDGRFEPLPADSFQWTDLPLALLALFGTVIPLVQTLRHLLRRDADRQMLMRAVAGVVAVLALTRALVSWERVPVMAWNASAGFAAACLIAAGLAWSASPAVAGPYTARRRLATVLLVSWNAALTLLAI